MSNTENTKPNYLWDIRLSYMIVIIAVFLVSVWIVCAIADNSRPMHSEWMKMCVMTQVSTYNKTGEDAFAHCKGWKEWLDNKDKTGWKE